MLGSCSRFCPVPSPHVLLGLGRQAIVRVLSREWGRGSSMVAGNGPSLSPSLLHKVYFIKQPARKRNESLKEELLQKQKQKNNKQ